MASEYLSLLQRQPSQVTDEYLHRMTSQTDRIIRDGRLNEDVGEHQHGSFLSLLMNAAGHTLQITPDNEPLKLGEAISLMRPKDCVDRTLTTLDTCAVAKLGAFASFSGRHASVVVPYDAARCWILDTNKPQKKLTAFPEIESMTDVWIYGEAPPLDVTKPVIYFKTIKNGDAEYSRHILPLTQPDQLRQTTTDIATATSEKTRSNIVAGLILLPPDIARLSLVAASILEVAKKNIENIGKNPIAMTEYALLKEALAPYVPLLKYFRTHASLRAHKT